MVPDMGCGRTLSVPLTRGDAVIASSYAFADDLVASVDAASHRAVTVVFLSRNVNEVPTLECHSQALFAGLLGL